MADHIIQYLFYNHEDFMPKLAIHGQFRACDRDFESAQNGGVFQILSREAAQVISERLQRVVLRIDGPHDDIECFHQSPGPFRNRLESGMGLIDGVGQSRRAGEEIDFREPRTEVVMEVASNAGAFCLEGVLALHTFARPDFLLEQKGSLGDLSPQ